MNFEGEPEEVVKARKDIVRKSNHPCPYCRKIEDGELPGKEEYEKLQAEEARTSSVQDQQTVSVQLCNECGKPLGQHRKKLDARSGKWITVHPVK
jgi:hypothetical protein